MVVAGTLGACASMPRQATVVIEDRNEETNRSIATFNQGFNRVVTRPAVGLFQAVVPQFARDRISSGINNINEPTVFLNNILQGRFDAAGKTATRFFINSTIGFGGLFDVAALEGIPQQTGDFGQTMFVWGVYDSPFVVVPFLGPTTIRDGIGQAIDAAASPAAWGIGELQVVAPYVIGGYRTIEQLQGLEDVELDSVDYYARLRSVYIQKRRGELLEAIGQTESLVAPGVVEPMPIQAPVPGVRPASRRGGATQAGAASATPRDRTPRR